MKEDRVEFRTTHQERKQFETAAGILGMNLSSFLRMTAVEKASEILRQNTSIVLSDEDRDAFLNALQNPPKPNKELKKALLEHRRTVKFE
ncbi:MAG: DUF1778 domain-containing protein [Parachlamydia sp.]|nr:DUF1778 domain-containing protein [Parachlamydia sp.]